MLRKFVIIITLLASIGVSSETALSKAAQNEENLAYKIKAAYILNFAKFVSWPEKAFDSAESPFVIGILGTDPFGEAISPITTKTVGGRKIILRYFQRVEEVGSCHFLFVGLSESDKLKEILSFLSGQNIATVSEMDGFVQAGGIFQFMVKDERINFLINLKAAHENELSIASQLLDLAMVVFPEKK